MPRGNLHSFGNLLVPNPDPFEAPERFTADELRLGLEAVVPVVEKLGLRELWSKTRFWGTGYSAPEEVLKTLVEGTWMEHAPCAGVGFMWEGDTALQVFEPSRLRSLSSEQRSSRRISWKAIETRLESRRRRVAEYDAQFEAICRIEVAAEDSCPIPLRPALLVAGHVGYSFEEGYRRRLAYTLGYEASLVAHSFDPIQRHFAALSTGSCDALIAGCPPAADRFALSIYLNLLKYLNDAQFEENRTSKPYYHFQGFVREVEAKRAFLEERSEEAAELRRKRLNSDGRLALAALLQRAREVDGDWLPEWGIDTKLAPEDLEE